MANVYNPAESRIKLGALAPGGGRIAAPAAPRVNNKFGDKIKELALKGVTDIGGRMMNQEFNAPDPTGKYLNYQDVEYVDDAGKTQTTGAFDSWDMAKKFYEDKHQSEVDNWNKTERDNNFTPEKNPEFYKARALWEKNNATLNTYNKGIQHWKSQNPLAGSQIVDRDKWGKKLGLTKPELKDGFVWKEDVDRGVYKNPARSKDLVAAAPSNIFDIRDDEAWASSTEGQAAKETAVLKKSQSDASAYEKGYGRKDPIRTQIFAVLQDAYQKNKADVGLGPEYFLSGSELEAENKKDALESWIEGDWNLSTPSESGSALFKGMANIQDKFSPAMAYFQKYPEALVEFKKNPMKWYLDNIDKNKTNFRKHSWFGN